jgi:hypothetical protein
MASTRPSFPAPSEPNLRRLGMGSQAERPIRAQLVVLGVGLSLLIAVPLYLWRKPTGKPAEEGREARALNPNPIRTEADGGVPKAEVVLAPLQQVGCGAAPNRPGNDGSLCDRLPKVEQELVRAIKSNGDCAPRTGKEGSINYVLNVDFSKREINIYPGASGSWKGPQAKVAAKCVQKSFGEIDWEGLPHRYRFYSIAVMASYPPPDPLGSGPSFDEP